MNIKRASLLGVALSCALLSSHAQVRLLVVDTQGRDPYYYRNLLLLANSVGFAVDYRNLYDLLEKPNIDAYDALFFMLNPALLSANMPKKLYCKIPKKIGASLHEQCLNSLLSFALQKNKGVGLILPGSVSYSPAFLQQVQKNIGVLAQLSTLPEATQTTVASFLSYLSQPDSKKGTLFGTGLLNKGNPEFATLPPETSLTQYTPVQRDRYTADAQKAFPIGMLFENPHTQNIYLLSKNSEFDFADIAEHFFKNPLSITARNELLQAAQETLQAFYHAIQNQKLSRERLPALSVPPIFELSHLIAQKEAAAHQHKKTLRREYRWLLKPGLSCAWFDPYDCFAHEDKHQKIKATMQSKDSMAKNSKQLVEAIALDRGIKIIRNGNFSIVWFEFIPEWYLSPRGLRKKERQEYIDRILKLSRTLKQFFTAQGKPLPKIFVGMNLTSNFRTNTVRNPTRNVFGTSYSKIPSPFDVDQFWRPEVIDVFASFAEKFKNEIPIDGIFFDFEMYHAPDQTGQYTDHMDFSNHAWKAYSSTSNDIEAQKIKSFSKRIAYLQKEKKFKQYFTILEQEARNLGSFLKTELRKIVPNLMFGAYPPSLPLSWFYRGIEAGLSSPSEPLLLATFNTDYTSHDRYLKKHDIHLLHGTAIMLSKLKEPKDFSLITRQLLHHDFVWYNRPSRMIYEYNQKELDSVWWGIEATPLSPTITMKAINKSHRIASLKKQTPLRKLS